MGWTIRDLIPDRDKTFLCCSGPHSRGTVSCLSRVKQQGHEVDLKPVARLRMSGVKPLLLLCVCVMYTRTTLPLLCS